MISDKVGVSRNRKKMLEVVGHGTSNQNIVLLIWMLFCMFIMSTIFLKSAKLNDTFVVSIFPAFEIKSSIHCWALYNLQHFYRIQMIRIDTLVQDKEIKENKGRQKRKAFL